MIKRTTTTTTKSTAKISRTELMQALQHICPEIPLSAEVFVRVPGGGDWSNTDLHIEDTELTVIWSETKTE